MKINAQRIEIAMAERGLNQKKLSEASGIATQQVSIIIRRGTAAPETVGKLAAALGVKVADIV